MVTGFESSLILSVLLLLSLPDDGCCPVAVVKLHKTSDIALCMID